MKVRQATRLEKTKDVQMKLEIIKEVLTPPDHIDSKTKDGNQLFLSDAKWEKASVG